MFEFGYCEYTILHLGTPQAWAIDITYIPMAKGFLYLVAIIDWYSRKVLAWRLSNTMDTSFCIEALEEVASIDRDITDAAAQNPFAPPICRLSTDDPGLSDVTPDACPRVPGGVVYFVFTTNIRSLFLRCLYCESLDCRAPRSVCVRGAQPSTPHRAHARPVDRAGHDTRWRHRRSRGAVAKGVAGGDCMLLCSICAQHEQLQPC